MILFDKVVEISSWTAEYVNHHCIFICLIQSLTQKIEKFKKNCFPSINLALSHKSPVALLSFYHPLALEGHSFLK